MSHRRYEFHDPKNPDCQYTTNIGSPSPNADWCSCPIPAPDPPAARTPDPPAAAAVERLDEAASVAHDFIHGLNGVTKERASAAIWTIHNALRPLAALLGRTESWADGEVCDDCGLLVGPHTDSWWHADDALWLEVMEQTDPGEGPLGRRVGGGCLCPPCFTGRARAKGIHIFWHARVEYRDGEDVLEGQRRAGLRA